MRFLLCFLAIMVPWCAMGDIASTTYTNNALDAVVHKTGNETITGAKTFSDTIVSTKSGYILSGDNIGIRSNYNPLIGLISDGAGGYMAYLQATGTSVDDAKLYLGPTSTKAMEFQVSDGAISMPNTLMVAKTITVGTDVAMTTDSNQVATTKWTNDKIDAARGVIPNGGANSTQTAQIWVE